jgi:hypothetical protein
MARADKLIEAGKTREATTLLKLVKSRRRPERSSRRPWPGWRS